MALEDLQDLTTHDKTHQPNKKAMEFSNMTKKEMPFSFCAKTNSMFIKKIQVTLKR